MGGAYGYEKVNYELSKGIAGKLYSEIKENSTDRIVTDCGGCKLQIEAGTGLKVDHPIILVKEAYKAPCARFVEE
jgi:glycerol-3-phosphate dehydrogenase subunit C